MIYLVESVTKIIIPSCSFSFNIKWYRWGYNKLIGGTVLLVVLISVVDSAQCLLNENLCHFTEHIYHIFVVIFREAFPFSKKIIIRYIWLKRPN